MDSTDYIADLEEELRVTKEELRTTREELCRIREELRVAHERKVEEVCVPRPPAGL